MTGATFPTLPGLLTAHDVPEWSHLLRRFAARFDGRFFAQLNR